ncbi:hypothetical protein LDY54_17655, partial [Acinetobacter baumannii]|nr:hypothetical protein [Acinetobacter baumannii]
HANGCRNGKKANTNKGINIPFRIMYIMLNKGFGNLPYIRLCLLCVVALATFDLYCNPPQID